MNDPFQRSLAILAWMILPVVAGFVLWRSWLRRLLTATNWPDGSPGGPARRPSWS